MTTSTIGKLIGGLLGTVAASTSQSKASQSAQTSAAAIIVGQGAANERQLTIAGEATLFRDEGDVVVQFHPAFDFELRETTVGMKLIPALEPHWAVTQEHRGSLTDAIVAAIRSARSDVTVACESADTPRGESKRSQVQRSQDNHAVVIESDARTLKPAAEAAPSRRIERPRYGVVKEWGEKEFPDGKRPGKTYESFCLTLLNRGELVVLQGEGLRDAIAESRCRVGDNVEVKRLGKTKVPAVDARGRPKLDAAGAQILWDKWLWSINKKS